MTGGGWLDGYAEGWGDADQPAVEPRPRPLAPTAAPVSAIACPSCGSVDVAPIRRNRTRNHSQWQCSQCQADWLDLFDAGRRRCYLTD
jgi:predicted RNA-binding Zn-ribbon protein involved in translation (DUF1610 family)